MISVEAALERIFALSYVLESETVRLTEAAGRVLAEPVSAAFSQPPFAASAMDGYAVAGAQHEPGSRFVLIGESAAGHPYEGAVAQGEAVRIFTGAAVPFGAARVIIQEDVLLEAGAIRLKEGADEGLYIRAAGMDFKAGFQLEAPHRLRAQDLGLIAAMGQAELSVSRRPHVALLATGDELVEPGTPRGRGQIYASNQYALKPILEAAGAVVHCLPIANDTPESLHQALRTAREAPISADVIVTLGGASVGDHDLVQETALAQGLELDFYKIAMRPGKPLMAGRFDRSVLIGLPGNPVSSVICALVFLRPLLEAMQGLPFAALPRVCAQLTQDLPQNGAREHYMRAYAEDGYDGRLIAPMPQQDSALLSTLAKANALLVHAAHSPERSKGDWVEMIDLTRL